MTGLPVLDEAQSWQAADALLASSQRGRPDTGRRGVVLR